MINEIKEGLLWALFLNGGLPIFLFVLSGIISWFLIRLINSFFKFSFNFVPQITVKPPDLKIYLDKNNCIEFQMNIVHKGMFKSIHEIPIIFWIEVPNEEEKYWELVDAEGLVYTTRSKRVYCFQTIASAKKRTISIKFKFKDDNNGKNTDKHKFYIHFDKHIHPAYNRSISVDVNKHSINEEDRITKKNEAFVLVYNNKETTP